MAYWLIVLVVFLALAPLWHFMPNKRQRHQARMREAAATGGLFVEFRDLPLPGARRERLPAADRQVLYYGRRLPPARRTPRGVCAWWREGDDWRSQETRSAPPAVAAEMPAGVLAIGCSDTSCGCYWREQGGLEEVQAIAALLQCWAEELSGPGRGA